jgi:hypothetical protein
VKTAIKLRAPTAELLALPWESPLADWDPMSVAFRDIPVGPSRHLVRFVEIGDALLAVKEAPDRIVAREYDVLRTLESRGLPAVRPAGTVLRGEAADGLLVTQFLERSWQFRRLFMRLPASETAVRGKLLAAIAGLLVELHRAGVFWGDCSLANTLFVRDGQTIQAHLVDAETSAIHPSLSDGQRRYDLRILVENLAGGLIDIASRGGEVDDIDEHVAAAESVAETYEELWRELHRDLVVESEERWRIARHLERLNDLGYGIDELRIEPTDNRLHVHFCVAGREHHSSELRRRTGITVGEGQARILLNDFHAYASRRAGPAAKTALSWRTDVFAAGLALVSGLHADPVQAFCDLLEVRWLLSEQAGHDVGNAAALQALETQHVPAGTAASLSVLEPPTLELPTGQPPSRAGAPASRDA